MQNDTPVLVLRLDHHGALGVIRSLGRLGVPVYGLHRDRDTPVLRSRYLRGHFLWNLDEETERSTVERLLAIAAELGKRPILLPTNDETALFVAAHAEKLRSAFRFRSSSSALVQQLYDKHSMCLLANRLGIPTAQTFFPRSRSDLASLPIAFPVMLKGADGIRLSQRTGEKMWIVDSRDELYQRFCDDADLMVQEYIPGGEDAQWMFNGYFDARSVCLFGITGRKLRQTPPYTGMTSLGVCAPRPEVERLVQRLVTATGYQGILDIGFRFDARDGRYKVLDVNPRLGATFRLFAGDDGLDVVRALYLDLTDQPVPLSLPCLGRKWQLEDCDLVSSLRYFQDGALGPWDWLRSLAGVSEHAWFARDDLAPFFDMCRRFGARAAGKLKKRIAQPAESSPSTAQVARHFARVADDWQRIYEGDGLDHRIITARHSLALRWIDSLPLPRGAEVLEVGSGAGRAAVAIAERGHRVHSIDLVPEMIALTRRAAGDLPVTTSLGDVHDLALADGRFDVVIALGVLPWLSAETRALSEMARVLRRGGFLIASADNRDSLHQLLDPRKNRLLAPLRSQLRAWLRRPRRDEDIPLARTHSARDLDGLIRGAGLEIARRSTVGFGPFSLLGARLFPERAGVALQERLQKLAEREFPILHSTGAHHLILAQKLA